MVSTIGSAASHRVCSRIRSHFKNVLSKGGRGTASNSLHRIADVDVGENIGAKLQLIRRTPTSKLPRQRLRSGARWPLL